MTPEQATRLGAMLRQARQDQGLTIRQLEELSGVGDTTIVRIEQGTLKEPPAERLQRLALALDLPVEDVYAEAGLQMPENLPSFQPYLRAKYPSMPAEAEAELHHYFDRIARKYGFSSTGPAPGEDDDTPRSRNTTKGGTHATHQQPRRQQRPQSARGAAASRARRTPPSR